MTERPRVVLDTGVLISRIITPSGVAARAADLALLRCEILTSHSVLDELMETLARPKFDKYISLAARHEFGRFMRSYMTPVQVGIDVRACRDPRDDKFLALAQAGRASLLVSGDDDLLAMKEWESTSIIKPSQFLLMY